MAVEKVKPKAPRKRGKSTGILSQDEIDALLSADDDDLANEDSSKASKDDFNEVVSKTSDGIMCPVCGDDVFTMVWLKVDGNRIPALISDCRGFSIVFGDVKILTAQAYNDGLKKKTEPADTESEDVGDVG